MSKKDKILLNLYTIGLIVWSIFVSLMLLLPNSSFEHRPRFLTFKHADWVVHFCLFAGVCFLLYKNIKAHKLKNHIKNLEKTPFRITHIALPSILIVSMYGLLTEILQGAMYNIAGRTFSLVDWTFDTLSAIFTCSIIIIYERLTNCSGKKYSV